MRNVQLNSLLSGWMKNILFKFVKEAEATKETILLFWVTVTNVANEFN